MHRNVSLLLRAHVRKYSVLRLDLAVLELLFTTQRQLPAVFRDRNQLSLRSESGSAERWNTGAASLPPAHVDTSAEWPR